MSDKLPPQNLEAERSVLGALLIDPEAWDQVSDIINEDDFYRPGHRKIFAAVAELHRRGMPADLITVSNQLRDTEQLEASGGPNYLVQMIDELPSTSNVSTYARILTEKSTLRRLIHTCQNVMERGYAQEFESLSSFLDQTEAEIFSVANTQKTSGLVSASELVKSTYQRLEELFANQAAVTGVPTGFIELDDMTAGFQPGEMIIIAARPSMGKTAFSLNLALHASLREKKKVAYFSVEMPKEAVMMRLLSIAGKVPLGQMRTGQITEKNWPRIIDTAAKLSDTGLFIDDTTNISPFEIRAKSRRMKAKHGLDLIVIDYLQLMSMNQRVESREREVAEISKMLKGIAKELRLPVVALAQLNRGVEGRSDRRPMLSDLRESGSIEQDADVIAMLYREDYYERENPEVKGLAEVIIAKQRNGPTGTVKLKWIPEFGVFLDNIQTHGPPPEPPPPKDHRFRGAPSGLRAVPSPTGGPPNFAPGGGPSVLPPVRKFDPEPSL